MLIEKIDRYMKSIMKDEEIKIKDLSIYEISEILLKTENKDDVLSRLDKKMIEKLRKMEEGGLI